MASLIILYHYQIQVDQHQHLPTGTPNGVDDDKLYPFTLQAIGVGSNSCVSEIIEGSILVQNSHEIGLSINSKATQEICAGDEIEPITINWEEEQKPSKQIICQQV